MKPMILSKLLTAVVCVLMLGAVVPTQAVADQAQYIYDDAGRLRAVIDPASDTAIYAYL
ncbi:MAG: RHS repeat protein [Nitrospira sp.]|nr:RHS repeat protein [Nitrospira sp.]